MNRVQRLSWGLVPLFVSFCVTAQGQGASNDPPAASTDRLPAEMKGLWSMNSPFYTGRSGGCDWSVKIEKQDADGTIAGKLSFCGNYCNADNAPMQGTYREGTLVMKAELGSQCTIRPFELVKGKKHRFEQVWPNGATFYLD